MEEIDDFQDIDLARFVPKEVDNAGYNGGVRRPVHCQSSAANDTDGEMLLSIFFL